VPGPRPAPRRRLNPKLRELAREIPSWKIAAIAGFTHPQRYSTLLHAKFIQATPTNIERWQRVADALNFPRAEIFLADEQVSA